MTELIQEYLLLNKTASIKGWGTLQIVPVSAELDFTNRLLYPPYTSFDFSAEGKDDPFFLLWLSTRLHISGETILQKLNVFTVDFKQSVASLKKVTWVGYGIFSKSIEGALTFVAQPSNKHLLQPVTAIRVIRKGAEHVVRVGEDERTSVEMEEFFLADVKKKKPLWVLNTLLLLSIGIILAWYFANNHKILWKQFANYQLLQPKESPVLYKKP